MPAVSPVLHQLVIAHLHPPSILPLKTNPTPTFQSLWRPLLQRLATDLSTLPTAAFYVSNKGRAGMAPGDPYLIIHIPALQMSSDHVVKGFLKDCEAIHPSKPMISLHNFLSLCHLSSWNLLFFWTAVYFCPSLCIFLHGLSFLPIPPSPYTFRSFQQAHTSTYTHSSRVLLSLTVFSLALAPSRTASRCCLWQWGLKQGKKSPLCNMETINIHAAAGRVCLC